MTFTVTYREKDGAKAEVEIEAVNRSECFAQCKARGIAPLGVREGRSGRSTASPKSATPRRSGAPAASSSRCSLYLAAAVLFVAVIGGGAWWWFGRSEARPAQKGRPQRYRVGGRKQASLLPQAVDAAISR